MKRYLAAIAFCAIVLLLAIIVLIGRHVEQPAAPPDGSKATPDSSVIITFQSRDPAWQATAPDKKNFRYTTTNSQPFGAATRKTN